MRTPNTIRSAAMKYYQTAKVKLYNSQVDSNEVKEAIEDFHNTIDKMMDLQEIAEVEGLAKEYYFTAEDYRLLNLAHIGITCAYGKVTKGVQPDDINFHLKMAKHYLELSTQTPIATPTAQNKNEATAIDLIKRENISKKVFDILAIKHTQDFQLVKRAYMIKVMEHRATQPNKPLCPSLLEAWAEVNNPKKLSAYYLTCASEDNPEQNYFFMRPPIETPVYDAPNSMIDVFIPVYFEGIATNKSREIHSYAELYKLTSDSLKTFAATIDCSYYAQIITNISNDHQRVGVTAEEAEDIVNYHKHLHPALIVQISIPFSQLLDFHRPDKTHSKHLNKSERIMSHQGENEYFSLKPNTKIEASNILSIFPMDNYLNSRYFDEDIDDYWPKGFLFQPNVVPTETITNKQQLVPMLDELAQKEIKRLEGCWFSKEKIGALKKAATSKDDTKIQAALGIRRLSLVDYFFGRTNLPTTSEKNCYEVEFKNSEQNRL